MSELDTATGHLEALEGFAESYTDVEPSNLVDALIASGRFLSRIVGEEVVTQGMAAMWNSLQPTGEPCEDNWAELFEDSWTEALSWPLAEALWALNGYAFWGVVVGRDNGVEAISVEERTQFISDRIQEVSEFVEVVPSNWGLDISDIQRTLKAAEARWELDHGRSLDPEGMGLLAGATFKTIRNTVSSGKLTLDAQGRVPFEGALNWLEARCPNYRRSLWQIEEDVEDPILKGEIFFIPVAGDGSAFTPELEKAGGFYVGAKGEEGKIESFRDALSALQEMATPRWRRPNSRGNWGIVSGVRWERRSASDLGVPPAN